MAYLLTSATLNWFSDGCCDVKYLDLWDKAPVSYVPGQPIDESWQQDNYDILLTYDADGRIFQRATNHLFHYHFYPPDLLTQTSDFSLENRTMRVGDRVIQRMHILSLRRYPILDLIGITEIYNLINEPRRCGFTHVTVNPHIAEGEWTAQVTWHKNGNLFLNVSVISRPVPQEPPCNHKLIRARQLAMHQRSIAHFREQLTNS